MQFLLIFLLAFALPAQASELPPSAQSSEYQHGGGLNGGGCHRDRKRGGCHCHRAPRNGC